MRYSSEATRMRFEAMISPRLQIKGLVCTDHAWQLLRDHFAYSTICNLFRRTMSKMVDQQKAITTGKMGQYKILTGMEKKIRCQETQTGSISTCNIQATFIIEKGRTYCRAACGKHMVAMTPEDGLVSKINRDGTI